jgi:hypothetical protein
MTFEREHAVPSIDSARATWRTSTRSGGNGNCVQVAVGWRTSTHSGGNGECVQVAVVEQDAS